MRMLSIVPLLLLAAPLCAQAPADPSGHWEGTIQIPDQGSATASAVANEGMKIAIDLARNDKGVLAGTFSQPAHGVKGLPLSTVTADGRSIGFVVKGGEAPSTFTGTLSAEGTSIAGEVAWSGYTIPFALKRTGDARIAAVPKSARIGKELEGIWNGTLDLGPRQMRVVLTLMNQPDGSASGTIVSPDGSGVEIPVGIAQKDASVTIDVATVGASYAGVLNAGATELIGTWTQQSSSQPLTLRRR
jgi:hypothetical protein